MTRVTTLWLLFCAVMHSCVFWTKRQEAKSMAIAENALAVLKTCLVKSVYSEQLTMIIMEFVQMRYTILEVEDVNISGNCHGGL